MGTALLVLLCFPSRLTVSPASVPALWPRPSRRPFLRPYCPLHSPVRALARASPEPRIANVRPKLRASGRGPETTLSQRQASVACKAKKVTRARDWSGRPACCQLQCGAADSGHDRRRHPGTLCSRWSGKPVTSLFGGVYGSGDGGSMPSPGRRPRFRLLGAVPPAWCQGPSATLLSTALFTPSRTLDKKS